MTETHKDNNSAQVMTYLSLFNEIDKHFDKLLKTEAFLPYNDKLKQIISGQFPVSRYVRLFQNDLKYFGELRNHISHGLKMGEVMYAIPTQKAIDKLQEFVDNIVNPPLCIQFFKKDVDNIQLVDTVFSLLQKFKETHYSSMPVYDGVKFLGVITERGLLHWVSQQVMQENFINLAKLPVSEVPIFSEKNDFVFVSTEINIYQADEIFTKRRRSGRGLDVMFITQNGRSDEDIVGIVWDKDVALIDDFVV
ncbi:hypothetical protein AGMMS50249_6290 [candidate division SR1 bacterium]|nr:hypothetical protein AGMMS50249_6290 [candidate division SR1 bacterium]